MASSSAPRQEPATVAISNFEDFVAEPPTTSLTQVLIPSGPPHSHAYLGPLPDPAESRYVRDIFPSYPQLQARIFEETPFHFEFLKNPNRVFRASPKVEQGDYIAWLNKIESQKGSVWKKQGIFDLIQLSRYGPRYESTMLLAALQFWDVATHSLHLKCGMLSPTLLDVAAITGLKPLGEVFDAKQTTNNFDFPTNNAAFSTYIADHHDTTTVEVSDEEHIAFLTFWLSFFVFCSRSLQVAKIYIPLATQLHEARNINLAKLILGTLYQQLDIAASELKLDTSTDKLHIAGPMWLLQLWLLATFESKLNFAVPKDIRPTLSSRRTEGIRLAQLKSREKNLSHDEMFSKYFDIFYKCTTFTDTMAPFVRCTYGPSWFTNEFPSKSTENAAEINQIWQAYLSPSLLSIKLTSSSSKNLEIGKYFPSYLSRQFGLCQLRPAPVCLHQEELYTPKTERAYQQIFKKFHFKDLIFEPAEFQPRFSCTERFQTWWNEYYTKASQGRTDAEILETVYSALPSRIAEKNPSPGMAFNRNISKATSKQKKPAASTPPKTKKITTKAKPTEAQSTPTSTKRKLRTSPPAKSKPRGKQVVYSSSEDSDDEDNMPLIYQSRKKARAGKEKTSPGIIIREPQEQLQRPSPPRIQTTTEIPAVETAPPQTISPAPSPPREISTEAPIIQTPPIINLETTEEEHEQLEEQAATVVDDLAEKEPTVDNVEAENVEQATTSDKMEVEQSRETTSDEAEGEDETEEMTESDTPEHTSPKESTSSVMSNQDFSELKKTNPLGALKHLLSLSSSSSAMVSSASTASLTSAHQESAEELLQQLKAKVLEDSLLESIEKNPSESFAIKGIIDKLLKCKPSAELVNFLVEFRPIFETLALQISKRADLLKSTTREATLHKEATNSFQVSQTVVNQMETEVTKNKKALAEWDSKIQHYNEEIKALQARLADAEHQRKLVQERIETPQPELELKALEAIEHFGNAHQHETNLIRLKDELFIVESTITVNTRVFDRLKHVLQSLH